MIYILQIYWYIYITCMILTNSGWRTWEILFIFLQLKWVHFIVGKLCCAVLSCFSRVQLFVTLWTIALQAPLSMGKLYLSKAKSQTWLSDWTELNWKLTLGFPGSSDGKECPQCARPGFNPWVGKITWRRERLPTPIFLPREFHGQRSLADYSPRGLKESDTTEQLLLFQSWFCWVLSWAYSFRFSQLHSFSFFSF